MMKKNVKGFIGLFAGIAAFILIGVALFVPTVPVRNSHLLLHGGINVTLGLIGMVLGVAAIVFGVLSRKERDIAKGPHKAGIIAGTLAVLIAFGATGFCSMTRMIADYANGVPGNAVSKMDESTRKSIDEAIRQWEADLDNTQA